MSSAITLHPSQFRDLLVGTLVAADKEGFEPKIYGVLLEWGGEALIAVSTDRYRLARGTTAAATTGEDDRVLLARPDAEQLLKLMPRKAPQHATMTIVVTPAMIEFKYSEGSDGWAMNYRPQPHPFPTWQRLIPTEAIATDTIRFNPRYLADINKMPNDAKLTKYVEWSFGGVNKPAAARWEHNKVAWLYLLMPVRA